MLIGRRGSGMRESFVVRRIVQGEGVERVFPIHSPKIAKVEVKRTGAVRRAKLYYLRGLRGKAARIRERDTRGERAHVVVGSGVERGTVADAPHGQDQPGLARVLLQLLAQPGEARGRGFSRPSAFFAALARALAGVPDDACVVLDCLTLWTSNALEAAIMELPMDYRMPLVLRDIEGLSTTEAAAVMDLGEAAFKSRLHRARLAVRAAVEELVTEEDDA